MKEEEWREIKGYELYQVSNFGRVKSLPRYCKNRYGIRLTKERILKPINSNYPFVNLSMDKKRKTISIHKLVALTWLNHTPGKGLIIDHIDNNPLNNRLDNLQIITQSENILKNPPYSNKNKTNIRNYGSNTNNYN